MSKLVYPFKLEIARPSGYLKHGFADTLLYYGVERINDLNGVIYVGHGSEDGTHTLKWWQLEDAHYIIVCHPNQVRDALPDHYKSKIVGDWDGATFFTLLKEGERWFAACCEYPAEWAAEDAAELYEP